MISSQLIDKKSVDEIRHTSHLLKRDISKVILNSKTLYRTLYLTCIDFFSYILNIHFFINLKYLFQ